jgi:predicted NUDIX family phosphoesterase
MDIVKKMQEHLIYTKTDEKILVVNRNSILGKESINGFKSLNDFDYYQKLVDQNKEFKWRSQMEMDPAFKQIIPYLIFNYQDKFFLMQRQSTASETRLQSKYSLGIGGHVREDDILGKDLFDWTKREFYEEIEYAGSFSIRPLGIINDESNDVGKVHIGFAFLLTGDSSDISIRSELKSGSLMTLQECGEFYHNMETWTQIIFNHLNNNGF